MLSMNETSVHAVRMALPPPNTVSVQLVSTVLIILQQQYQPILLLCHGQEPLQKQE